MIKELKKILTRNLGNIKGWRTNRKIIVIESDDWGAVRMPSKAVYDELLASGLKMNNCSFCKYDAMASHTDLEKLFEVLLRHHDANGNNPIITANTIVANPDFDKIRKSNFTEYYYELFTTTLKRYPAHEKSFDLWKEGMRKGIFHPQLHGREHLNVARWMRYLHEGSEETKLTFGHAMFGISTNVSNEKRRSYMAAFDYENEQEAASFRQIVAEAQREFEILFGYPSKSFIAPNYTWGTQLEDDLADCGVHFIQGSRHQMLPLGEKGAGANPRHFTGEKNKNGQIYLVRNCIFEPAVTPKIDAVEECLKQVATAFFWRKPAIIGSHRLNFIGHIDEQNRERNLKLLDSLLENVVRKWPEVEFMTSDQLGNIITKSS